MGEPPKRFEDPKDRLENWRIPRRPRIAREFDLGDTQLWARVNSLEFPLGCSRLDEVRFAKRVLEAIPDGHGVHVIDGQMQDDATWKQCHVIVSLAQMLADRDPDLKTAYGF